MQFYKIGCRYIVVRVTGPSSYFLSFELGPSGEIAFEAIDRRNEDRTAIELEIEQQIVGGIKETSVELGFQPEVRKVQYAAADGGAPSIYRDLARELIARLSRHEPFCLVET